MNVFRKASELLSDGRSLGYLAGLHVLLVILAVSVPQPPSPDEATYLALADSMADGGFSVWDGVYDPAPVEVHRTHGYPTFLLAVRSISGSKHFLGMVQGGLYLFALWLVVRSLRRLNRGVFLSNLFLLLMIAQIQLLHYVGQVFPETLMVLFLTAYALSLSSGRHLRGDRWLLMVLLAASFWVRPIAILLPVFVLLGDLLLQPKGQRWPGARGHLLVAVGFVLLGPLPFAWWNWSNHGYFRPLPLTGSAVISNLGIWQLRLPGYGTVHYFQYNTFGRELLPWVGEHAAADHFDRYQAQWERIEQRAAPAMTPEDRERVPQMMEHSALWATRSPGYTRALDKAIQEENVRMIKAEPWYYLATRLYTAIRLWVTNINLPMEKVIYRPSPGTHPRVGKPKGVIGWTKVLTPFAITFITFGLGLPFIVVSIFRDRRRWYERRYLLMVIAYVWLVHVPMLIQSRYTVPVHVLAVMCLALAIADRQDSQPDPGAVV